MLSCVDSTIGFLQPACSEFNADKSWEDNTETDELPPPLVAPAAAAATAPSDESPFTVVQPLDDGWRRYAQDFL